MSTAAPIPPLPTTVRRNYLLGIANGALVRVGMALIEPSLVLSAFLYQATGSNTLVGLLGALAQAGNLWPQIFVSSWIEHRERKLPFYTRLLFVRLFVLLFMAAAMAYGGRHPTPFWLGVFFLAYFVFQGAMGSGAMPFFDIVGRTIAPDRLGSFFAWRGLLGTGLALVIGFVVVQPILGRVPFPDGYVLLVLGAFVAYGVGWGAFCFVRELPSEAPQKRRSIREILLGTAGALKENPNYRRLLLYRICFRTGWIGVSFYVPYGVERLGVEGLSGVFIGLLSASQLASSLVWGRLSDRRGNRLTLLWAAGFLAVSPAAVLIAPRLPELFHWPVPGVGVVLDLRLAVYLLALVLFGLGMQANMIANNSFLIEISPVDRRPSYVAFMNTALFPFTFLPALVGSAIGLGLMPLEGPYWIGLLGGAGMLSVALRFVEVRRQGER
ncbi:MAG: hypothetical protein KatS3mg115_1967 [Candidatus Poribacteria bacterium]|nr:MAG: hypothetical protein KatS3mg115_1967 [Candidatus Poribacteria bacterium]